MSEHAAPSHVTRRTVLAGSFAALGATLAGCSLRLEDDAPLPGPKASAAPDVRPLEAVRARLVTALQAAEGEHSDAADSAAAGLHHTQLTRLDATLQGLGASKPAPVPSATSSSTSAPTPTATPSGAASSPRAAASPTPTAPTAWTRAEAAWTSPTSLRDLAGVSQASRPLAMAIAARSLAALPSSTPAPDWPDGMSLNESTASAVATPLAAALAAQEWVAAKTALTQRAAVVTRLHWLSAATSLVESSQTASTSASPEPLRRFSDVAAADAFTRTALLNVISRCAGTAGAHLDADQAGGLLYLWSNAVATAQAMGAPQGPFAGLAES